MLINIEYNRQPWSMMEQYWPDILVLLGTLVKSTNIHAPDEIQTHNLGPSSLTPQTTWLPRSASMSSILRMLWMVTHLDSRTFNYCRILIIFYFLTYFNAVYFVVVFKMQNENVQSNISHGAIEGKSDIEILCRRERNFWWLTFDVIFHQDLTQTRCNDMIY